MPIPVTAVGNLTGEVELRWTQQGLPVASFSIAINKRVRNGDQWEDGEPSFLRCSVWRDQAEHVAESLQKGDSVIVQGSMEERKWDDKETGQKRSSWECTVDNMGPALRFATAKPQRVQSNRQQGSQQGTGDPWAASQPAARPDTQGRAPQPSQPQGGDPWGAGPPPF